MVPGQASVSFMLSYPQCSFGFIYEREQLEATCPQCHQTFCVRCKRQVRYLHPFGNTCGYPVRVECWRAEQT